MKGSACFEGTNLRVSPASEQNDRPAGTSPVGHLQLGVLIYGYKLHAVGAWILPSGGLGQPGQADESKEERVGAGENTIDKYRYGLI